MADGRPQPQPPLPPAQPAVSPASPTQLVVPPAQPGQVSQFNWSYFKAEFAGKPDKDAEAYLLRMNDWMDTHAF